MRAQQHLALGKGIQRKQQKRPSSFTSKQSFAKQKIPGSYIITSKDRLLQRKLKWGEDQRPDRKKQVVAVEDSIIRQINNGVHDPEEDHGGVCLTRRWWISPETWAGSEAAWRKSMRWWPAWVLVTLATDTLEVTFRIMEGKLQTKISVVS